MRVACIALSSCEGGVAAAAAAAAVAAAAVATAYGRVTLNGTRHRARTIHGGSNFSTFVINRLRSRVSPCPCSATE